MELPPDRPCWQQSDQSAVRRPQKIVVAAAVAPPESLALIRQEADEVICLQSPEYLFAVGQAFEDFSEVTDEMVVAASLLARRQAIVLSPLYRALGLRPLTPVPVLGYPRRRDPPEVW